MQCKLGPITEKVPAPHTILELPDGTFINQMRVELTFYKMMHRTYGMASSFRKWTGDLLEDND